MEGSSLFELSVRKAIRSANAPRASGQFIICSVQQNVPDYSYRRASMGSRLAARKAGNMPLQTPTRARIEVEINRILGATRSEERRVGKGWRCGRGRRDVEV